MIPRRNNRFLSILLVLLFSRIHELMGFYVWNMVSLTEIEMKRETHNAIGTSKFLLLCKITCAKSSKADLHFAMEVVIMTSLLFPSILRRNQATSYTSEEFGGFLSSGF
jgi:hypothetical protein